MKKMNKKGFSLVELLATIAIIGILSVLAIAGVSRYVNGAHEEQNEQNRKTVTMAAELYLQANQDMLPKRIGEKKDILLQQLRDSNFLKSDVKNDKGVSCMDYSFVRVYKLDKKEYSYTTFLYCGEEPTGPSDPPPMNITFNFVDASGNISSDGSIDSNKVKDVSFVFDVYGGKTDDKQGGDPVGVYSYEYSILVNNGIDGAYQEVYNSGTIKAGRENTITVKSDKLSKYIDVAGFTRVKVIIDATSEQGGTIHYESGTEGQLFQDQIAPTCPTKEMAANDSDWINKQSEEKFRRVTVSCQDNANGSGCKRKQFTQTWPYNFRTLTGINYKYGVRWSYIEIEDNAKSPNRARCYVRANVDLQAPEVTVKIYKANADGSKGGNVLNVSGGTFTVKDSETINDIMPSGTIQATEYKDLYGETSEKWMNLQNYPNGIIIDVEMKDNLYLDYYRWEVNNADLKSGTAEQQVRTLTNGSDQDNGVATTGTLTGTLLDDVKNDDELALAEHGTLSASVSGLRLKREGKRYGRLTVCDKANNCTTVHIFADIDRTPPPVPTVSYQKKDSLQAYYPANSSDYQEHTKWSNEHVVAYVSNVRQEDRISGWHHFNYLYRKQTGRSGNTYSWANSTSSGSSLTNFVIRDEGISRIHFANCDNAGNCSNNGEDDYVKVDTIKPECTITKKYEDNSSGSWVNISNDEKIKDTRSTNGSGWLNQHQRVTLSHKCEDNDQRFASECNVDSHYNKQKFVYDSDINTNGAGANGFGSRYGDSGDQSAGGHVVDYAGNVSDECPVMTVKIDHIAPSCETTISWPSGDPINQSDSTKKETGWLGNVGGTKKVARVGLKCTENQSGSSSFMSGVSSGCDDNGIYDSNDYNKKYHTYNQEINTTRAGAWGNGQGGKVIDVAGNMQDCPANRTVKIDYTAPTCTTSIEYGTGTSKDDYTASSDGNPSAAGWLGYAGDDNTSKKMAKVSQVCTDRGNVHSDCIASTLNFNIYDTEINTSTAGALGNNQGGTIEDRAGNVSNCPTNKTVRIDYTRPTCSVSAKSEGSGNGKNWAYANYDGRWLGPNAVVTITTTCGSAENGSGNSSGCNTNLTGTYNQEISTTQATSGGNNSAGVGKTVYVYDKADNRSASVCAQKTVKIDTSKPTCAMTAKYGPDEDHLVAYDGNTTGYNGWVKGTNYVRVYTKCDKDEFSNGTAGSGCSDTNWHSAKFDTPANTNLNANKGSNANGTAYVIKDKVGNEQTCSTLPVKIDNKPPTCTVTSKIGSNTYSGNWTNQTVTVERKCDDTGGSDCNTASAAEQKKDYYANYTNKQAGAIDINNGGTITDNVGNVTSCETKTINIDITPPTCTVTATSGGSAYSGAWTTNSVLVSRFCSDTGGSNCDATSAAAKSYTYSATAGHMIVTDLASAGGPGVAVSVSDAAGNSTSCDYKSVRIDKAPPTAKCDVDYSWYYRNSNNYFSVSTYEIYDYDDDIGFNGVGGVTISYYKTGDSAYNNNSYIAMNTLKCGTSSQTYTAYIKVKDSLGNESSPIACTGSLVIPSCCSSVTEGSETSANCSASCGWTGTYTRNDVSNYDGSVCQKSFACNRWDCCSSVRYEDNTSQCNATCSNGGTGTYARYAYSNYNNQRCPDEDSNYGGRTCYKECTVTAYQCRENTTHDTSYWYDPLSWVWLHRPGSLEQSGAATAEETEASYNGVWVGYNSTLQIQDTYVPRGKSYVRANVVPRSCGNVTVNGSTHSSFADGAYASGTCEGWIYQVCYHTEPNKGNCNSSCLN